MKRLKPLDTRGLLIRLGVIVAAYFVLFQVMARTNIMERVMSLSFNGWELIVIALFLVTRLAVYLIIPPLLIAVGVYRVGRLFLDNRKN